MNKNAKYGILLVGVVSLIMFSALTLSNLQDNTKLANIPPQDNTKLVNNEKNTNSVGVGSGSSEKLNDKELVNGSDIILIGTVKEILSSKYGNRFSKDIDFGPDHVIYTDIVISVDEYLKNPSSSKEVIVRVAGGTIGNDTLIMEDEPSFKTEEKVLLYLTKDTSDATRDIGPDHLVVTGLSQGKFTLTDDGKAVRPGKTVSKDELLSTIKE